MFLHQNDNIFLGKCFVGKFINKLGHSNVIKRHLYNFDTSELSKYEKAYTVKRSRKRNRNIISLFLNTTHRLLKQLNIARKSSSNHFFIRLQFYVDNFVWIIQDIQVFRFDTIKVITLCVPIHQTSTDTHL